MYVPFAQDPAAQMHIVVRARRKSRKSRRRPERNRHRASTKTKHSPISARSTPFVTHPSRSRASPLNSSAPSRRSRLSSPRSASTDSWPTRSPSASTKSASASHSAPPARTSSTSSFKRGALLALYGIAIGLVASSALSRLLSSFLFGVRPTDPLTFSAVAAILAAVALPPATSPPTAPPASTPTPASATNDSRPLPRAQAALLHLVPSRDNALDSLELRFGPLRSTRCRTTCSRSSNGSGARNPVKTQLNTLF